MAWYFRVIEHEDRSWLCRHGREVFDQHPTLSDAVEHIMMLAAAHPPAEVMVSTTASAPAWLDAVRQRGMRQDHSWNASASRYEALYRSLLGQG